MTAAIATHTVLQSADPTSIQQAFAAVAANFPNGGWLQPANRYALDVVGQLGTDAPNSIHDAELTEYLAASVLLHCCDGWAYLGRALDSHMRGDREGARHLAYYAELRGAVSFLAAQGIGVLNNEHVVSDSNGHVDMIPRPQAMRGWGTHVVAWYALDWWASQPSDALLQMISAGGRSLKEWVDAFVGTSGTALAASSQWLREWGIDLQRIGSDQVARNEASYRPSRLNHRVPMDPIPAMAFLPSLWLPHDPTGSPFSNLDRHLLRVTLEAVYGAVKTANPHWKTDPNLTQKFRNEVEAAVRNVVPQGMSEDQWVTFLTRQVDSDDLDLLRLARGASAIANPTHHVEVASRAALMLRLATGACSGLLTGAGVGRSELEFWWKPLGEERGLWEPDNEPSDLRDLWVDVSEALTGLETWATSHNGGVPGASYWNVVAEQAKALVTLGGCERVPLWALPV